MLEQGYIKLHRSLLNWEWYGDINTARLFLHLLLIANHDCEKWRGVTVERGQRVTSRAKLAEETGLTVDEIRTALHHLQTTGEITSKTTNKYTVITIVNYNKYQGDPQQNPSKSPSNSPPIPQPFPTKKESKKARKQEYTTTATTREAQLQRLSQFFEGNNFGLMAHSIMDDFAAYLDEGVDALLIERCMKEAVDCGTLAWKYVVRILERCRTQNIGTVDQFEAEKRKRESDKIRQFPKHEAKPDYTDTSRYDNMTMDIMD